MLTWEFTGPVFMAAVQAAWAEGTMGEILNSSMIALLPKGGDVLDADQWRPISLLTTFYKAVAKALALRIQPLARQWLEAEQRGFTQGRSIADNLLFLREAKWHAFHLVKARCLHAQWVVRALGPGSPPWHGLIMHRLQQCRGSATGPAHLCFVLSDSPRMVRGSNLWNSIWSSFEDIKAQLTWRGPATRDEVLAFPLCHFGSHWLPEFRAGFQRPAAAQQLWQAHLRCFGSCWSVEDGVWLGVADFRNRGLSPRLAAELAHALRHGLSRAAGGHVHRAPAG